MGWRVTWGTVSHTRNYSYIISLCTLSSQEVFRFSFLLNKALEIRAFIWLCPDQQRQRSWSWIVLWRPTRPFRTNTQKRCPFHYSGLESKRRSQETPEVTGKFGLGVQNEAGQRMIEFCQENALVIANTLFQQHKRRLYTWTSPDGQYQNQIDHILCSQRGKALYSQQKQDQELTVAHIMDSLLQNPDLNWRK